jgi:uncharacterized protein with PhoU and TrkA domain
MVEGANIADILLELKLAFLSIDLNYQSLSLFDEIL